MDRKDLIRGTINAIHDSIEHLKFEQDRIVDEISEKQKLLEIWQRELVDLNKGNTPIGSGRLPKGEPLRRVNVAYEANPVAQAMGFTVKEIEKATGLGWTTVRNVVRMEKNGFVEVDGKWRRSIDIEKDKQRRLKLATTA